MNRVSKRMILKGRYPCILTVSGADTAEIKVEWLRGSTDDPIRVFCSENSFDRLQNGHIGFPAEQVTAAAIGDDLHTRGQFGSFDWSKAKDYLRILECSCNKPPINKGFFQDITDPAEISEPDKHPEDTAPENNNNAPYLCPCKLSAKPIATVPFPREFPESEWLRHEYPSAGGSWHYLTGIIYQNGSIKATATAVPGKYNSRPPAWLKEFSLFLQNAENRQGYWVAISPFQANSTITEETQWNPKQ